MNPGNTPLPTSWNVAVILKGARDLPGLEALGYVLHRADSTIAAWSLIGRVKPQLVLVHGDVPWHQTVIAALPADRRPAVIALGGSAVSASLADEWLPTSPGPGVLAGRVRLARERAQARLRAARRVFHDPLTGLPNRRAVVRALVRESWRARRAGSSLSLVLMDLDDFKRVNETYGHDAGDRLLRKVGAALARVTRADEMCGRIGGDEFALVVARGVPEAGKAARRIEAALREIGVGVTTACGMLKEGEGLRELYRRADVLLRQSKHSRRSTRPAGFPAAGRVWAERSWPLRGPRAAAESPQRRLRKR